MNDKEMREEVANHFPLLMNSQIDEITNYVSRKLAEAKIGAKIEENEKWFNQFDITKDETYFRKVLHCGDEYFKTVKNFQKLLLDRIAQLKAEKEKR